MLKIIIKEGENIDRALKRYKRKTRNTKLLNQLRENKQYTKKSVKRRKQKDGIGQVRKTIIMILI